MTALLDSLIPTLPPVLPPDTPPRTRVVQPRTRDLWLLLTALRPLSHHDPAQNDDSNTLLFNREAKLLPMPQAPARPSPAQIEAFCAAHPVPPDVAGILADLGFVPFVACAFIRLFLDLYNRGEGTGLFAGKERYERLDSRLHQAAVRAWTLRGLWDALTDSLNVPLHPVAHDADLLAFFGLPPGLQALVTRACRDEHRSLVSIARLWHADSKRYQAEYAAASGQAQLEERSWLHFEADAIPLQEGGVSRVDVPDISNNSLRHQVARAPGFLHLCAMLGLSATEPGMGPLPAGAEALFVNGGNIASGAKQPSNPFGLAQAARQAYPLLDLLGGVADSFDLGESALSVGGWLVCRENARALADTPAGGLPLANVSAFDMLDTVTHTRQATEQGRGQMILSFEALCAGAQIVCRLSLKPFTQARTQGALVAAVQTYLGEQPVVGGQSARGFGFLQGEWVSPWADADRLQEGYEAYLTENADVLRAGLEDGTLTSGKAMLT